MSFLYKLLHRSHDNRLRNDPQYVALLDFGYIQTSLIDNDYGLGFEKKMDDYLCVIYLKQGKVVTTLFFEPFESAGNAFSLLGQLLDDDLSVGRNFIESRIPFGTLTTEAMNKTAHRLLAIVRSEGLMPPDKKSTINMRNLR